MEYDVEELDALKAERERKRKLKTLRAAQGRHDDYLRANDKAENNTMEADKTQTGGGSGLKGAASFASGMKGAGAESGTLSKLGGGAMTAGMATGNPYLMAAGAGAQVVGGIMDRRRKEEQQNIDREMERRGRVMTAMANLGTGVGSIG